MTSLYVDINKSTHDCITELSYASNAHKDFLKVFINDLTQADEPVHPRQSLSCSCTGRYMRQLTLNSTYVSTVHSLETKCEIDI